MNGLAWLRDHHVRVLGLLDHPPSCWKSGSRPGSLAAVLVLIARPLAVVRYLPCQLQQARKCLVPGSGYGVRFHYPFGDISADFWPAGAELIFQRGVFVVLKISATNPRLNAAMGWHANWG